MTTTPLSTLSATRKAAPQAAPPGHGGLRSLVVDVGVPLASYYLLRAAGCDVVVALALSSVAPAVHAVLDVIRRQVVNGLAVLVLAVNVLSVAVSFWSGNPRVMLAKDGAVSSAIGIAILISVLAGRPLMTAMMRPFIIRGDAARDAAFGRLAATSPRFHSLERRFSVVWGIACLGECAGRVACAFTLPAGTTVWLSTVLLLASIGAGIVAGSLFSVPIEKMVVAEARKLKEGQ
jgi:hypothetical protein